MAGHTTRDASRREIVNTRQAGVVVAERVAAVAGPLGVSEPTALLALPDGWAQQQAAEAAVEVGRGDLGRDHGAGT